MPRRRMDDFDPTGFLRGLSEEYGVPWPELPPHFDKHGSEAVKVSILINHLERLGLEAIARREREEAEAEFRRWEPKYSSLPGPKPVSVQDLLRLADELGIDDGAQRAS